jgi:hypothetical protein
MKIFRANVHIKSVTIIADDIQHASHVLLSALGSGLRHWPDVKLSLEEWSPQHDMEAVILQSFADQHFSGLAHCVDGGWEVIRDKIPDDQLDG